MIKPTAKTQKTTESTSIRVNIDKVDQIINLVGELVITSRCLARWVRTDMGQLHLLRDGLAQLERNTRELQEDVMRMRMLPISFTFNRFPVWCTISVASWVKGRVGYVG
ncbi:hypothetical protein [Candidatus Reidiella endopervernicosa]|uniref:hypothetical protein n=1 Tax=Candidatus Reidiella endopervernicosa TaxID=2738883 RepID=UPI002A4E245A|nr:hypothetical protein [Candidatus Reidiella endopervernicosa]